ncbi:type II toxin-antitoxin system VapC family toxin [Nocardia camponoti]|uniref:PIN domain-containing protein n=1 Tax=Nocardia camponoti TaxID=1616106 RepID=A0A917QI45_9NOCA|nr:type II toxin-antitoxin system VapC family toxin [Nocardia camponoti]GGK51685.1 hypothetical protein GCM10011591_24240 [Nocardia camponoti]
MIAYFDTSAFVPLLVDEPSSVSCAQVWDLADDVVSNRLLYVESAAALAQAERMGRLEMGEHEQALAQLDELWAQLAVLAIDESLVRDAAVLAAEYALRGYDAVHCAAAAQLQDPDLVAISGDRKLLAAWKALGVATIDTNAPVD